MKMQEEKEWRKTYNKSVKHADSRLEKKITNKNNK